MTVQELQQELKADINVATRVFGFDNFRTGSVSIRSLVSQLSGGTLSLTGASLALDGAGGTVIGLLNFSIEPSTLVEPGNRSQVVNASARFAIVGDSPVLRLTLTGFTQPLLLSSFFGSLKDTVFDSFPLLDLTLTVDSSASTIVEGQQVTPWQVDARPSGLPADMPALGFLGLLADNARLTGHLTVRHRLPEATLTLPFAKVALGSLSLPVALSLSSRVVPQSGDYGLWSGLRVDGNLVVAVDGRTTTIPLSATLPRRGQGLVSLCADLENVSAQALSSLSPLLNETPLGSATEGFDLGKSLRISTVAFAVSPYARTLVSVYVAIAIEKSWPVTGDASVSLTRLAVLVSNPTADAAGRRVSVTVFGAITIGGAQFDVTTMLPDLVFNLRLAPGTTLQFRDLGSFLHLGTTELPEFTVSDVELSLTSSRQSQAWSFSGTLSDWQFAVEGLTFTIERLTVFASRAQGQTDFGIAGTFKIGGFEFQVTANNDLSQAQAGWNFAGNTSPGQVLNLTKFATDLAAKFGLSVPAEMPEIEATSIAIAFNTAQKSFRFSAFTSMSVEVPFGEKTISLKQRVVLSSSLDPASKKRVLTGHVEADFTIGTGTIVLQFDFGPVTAIEGAWIGADSATIGWNDIVSALGIATSLACPDGLDLALTQVAFSYDARNQRFTLSGQSKNYGDAFLTVGKTQDGIWGVVFGVDLPAMTKLSAVPVVGSELSALDGLIVIKQAAFLIANAEFKDYTIPQLPALVPPPDPTMSYRDLRGRTRQVQPLAASQQLQLGAGLSLAAVLDFAASASSPKMKNLHSVAAQDTLVVQVSLQKKGDLSIYAALAGKVGIPTGSSKLTLTNPAIRIDFATQVIVQFSGSMHFTAFKVPISCTARLIIDESEAEVSIDIQSPNATLPGPPTLRGVHFTEFGVEMGVYFEPPGLDLGLEGKFKIGEVTTSNNRFAVVFEVIEEVPNVLFLSFYIDDINLGQAFTLFTDREAPDAVRALNAVRMSDVSFYWAENVVVLPDGTSAQPGLGFSAAIQIFAFTAHASLTVDAAHGISGDAQMSPVKVGDVLRISGDGKGITQTWQQVNGTWRRADNSQIVRAKTLLPTRQEKIVDPGGPVFQINSNGPPYLHLSCRISLFDIVEEAVEATIDRGGITFALKYNIRGVEKFILNCTLRNWKDLSAVCAFTFRLNLPISLSLNSFSIGNISLQSSLEARFALHVSMSEFALSIDGSFEFGGMLLRMPRLRFDRDISSLTTLPEWIIRQIKQRSQQIFSFLADPYKWAEWVNKGLITNYGSVADVLQNGFGLGFQDAARLMKDLGQSLNDIATMLKSYVVPPDAAAALLKSYGFACEGIGIALQSVFGQPADVTGGILKGLDYPVNEVAGAIKAAYATLGSEDCASVLRGVGYGASETASGIRAAYSLEINAMAVALRAAGYEGIKEVGNALGSAYGFGADSANRLAAALKSAGYVATDVGGFLHATGQFGETAIRAALDGAGYATDQVAKVMGKMGG